MATPTETKFGDAAKVAEVKELVGKTAQANAAYARMLVDESATSTRATKIGRAGQEECRDRDLHSFPTRLSSDLGEGGRGQGTGRQDGAGERRLRPHAGGRERDQHARDEDRKGGSGGMPGPRSTLFPYTTLFRSRRRWPRSRNWSARRRRRTPPTPACWWTRARPARARRRSEGRVRRNAGTEIYTLSLHDSLPISAKVAEVKELVGKTAQANAAYARMLVDESATSTRATKIGRAGQEECRDRDLHSFPTRLSSDLGEGGRGQGTGRQDGAGERRLRPHAGGRERDQHARD